ncbi:RNA polymerase factor sigma-54 [Sandaracinobacteroides saxicola]|uniref:RNA polymerase sigma-54 factor n=1 Tax=Sandaracinobacteroides saxicola TaxID=2759707 RepID=A0A7G5IFZ4_9SPHN|nr:RNA polymerase factor sigma-54 [Sandaracinobacteroides saxicola]QMW22286.1 RNA polymerase factor sigma-54 [Sandaracinobacteroides saxicola]
MALGPRLDLRQTQQLVITPQLQAAIRLLTLSNMELSAHIEEELEKNPLLELAEEPSEPVEVSVTPDASEIELTDQLVAQSEAQAAGSLDVDLVEERFHHDCAGDSGGGEAGEEVDFDSFAAEPATLAEVLQQQAGAVLSGAPLMIATHLIDLIDDSGYLTGTLEEVAERLGVAVAEVAAVLKVIQGFEPTGVGARNLAECLAIQAREADRYDPCMAALIDNLELVARGDLASLRRLCRVDAEDLADMLRELRGYNPRPGMLYGGGRIASVVPDVFIARTAKGWQVELNNGTLPRLIVNRSYAAELVSRGGKAERAFVEECSAQAGWLMRALDQRAQTILKVATELVRQQEGFFERGVAHMKPLTLRMIADAIEMHESTVSRVTSNKYLSCARGLFEMKYFFTNAVPSEGGEASAEAVRARVRDIIAGEDPMRPLSDDKLVELLRGEGFDLARRTVTKYREALGIATSFDRRRRALVKAA